jgi:hypothetical protein
MSTHPNDISVHFCNASHPSVHPKLFNVSSGVISIWTAKLKPFFKYLFLCMTNNQNIKKIPK